MPQGSGRIFWTFAAVALGVLLTSASAAAQVPGVGATAQVRDASGQLVATADFRQGRNEVLITLTFAVPPLLSGTHAVHINEVGRCDPPDFGSSGAIFNPFNKQHGRQNPDGAEVGDLPNVNFSGGLTAYNTTAVGATLGQGQGSLLAPASRALVIFSGEDDQRTGPEGGAGARIACGVIVAAAGPSAGAGAASSAPGGAGATPAAAVAGAGVGSASSAPGAAVATPGLAARAGATPAATGAGAASSAAGGAGATPAATRVGAGAAGGAGATPAATGTGASPAARTGGSPVVVVSKPAAAGSAASPAALPTPIGVLAAAPSGQASNGLSAGNALILAVLGAALITVGYLLRQGRALR